MSRRTLWFMTVAVALIVANVYYIQPLLAQVARTFNLQPTGAGTVAMVMQLGTTLAMMVFVPLGDTHERRSLIGLLLLVLAAALVAMAFAQNVWWLCAAGAAVGASGSVVHLIIPFAAHLARPAERGRVVGQVIGGLLIGVLLARTLSGWVGGAWGWRAMYGLAAVAMVFVAIGVRFFLPLSPPELKLTYPELVKSILQLAREQPVLREASLLGLLFFCAFSAFWTTLIFRLEATPFHYGAEVAGSFGLVGAVGAGFAPFIGRIADRHGSRFTVGAALVLGLVSFLILGFGGNSVIGLVIGVIVLDLGVQAGHVANQTRIYNLIPSARGRLNTVYMTCYFVGGSIGSLFGAWGWRLAGWWGVCAVGLAAMALGLVVFARKPAAAPQR
jgi:predicted MFS family arabinose efflux permease